jgi:hypothetical protein
MLKLSKLSYHKPGSIKRITLSGSFNSVLYLFNKALIITITEPSASAKTCKNTPLIFKFASLAIKKNH